MLSLIAIFIYDIVFSCFFMQVHLFNWVKEEIFLQLFVFCFAKPDTSDVP